MPILIDLSQVAISNLMKSPNIKNGEIDSMLIKHMVLNSIRAYKQKFGREYGQIVVCCDSKHYWRRNIFPHYKAHRKKTRSASSLDWDEIFDCISELKDEIRTNFPYKVLEVYGAEGDDIVAIVAMIETEPTLIIGSDKDYCQLQSYTHVKQYSPTKKTFITVDNPEHFLNELVITGDKDDGIPNIRSDADTFVKEGKRQKSIRKADLGKWKALAPEKFCETRTMLENHARNKELIDFNFIPKEIVDKVKEAYAVEPEGNKQKIMKYFMDNRMRNLLADVDQF